MRWIRTFTWVTADGYFAAPDGNLAWVVPDDEQARAAVEGLPRSDTVLFGRRTYELFEGFWRPALEDPAGAPDPHHPGRRSPEHHAIAVWMNRVEKLVFSRTLREVTWNNARIVRELDPRAIEALKHRPGGDMMIFGSGSIVSQLTEHGLIDEYQFGVCPVFLGSGRPLLTGISTRVKLTLVESKRCPSGDILLRYERAS